MIAKETLVALARRYQTSEFPNVLREYFQHVFLSDLYQLRETERVLFKGGTALRIVYGSPRFSEDIDFSLFGVEQRSAKRFVEDLFIRVLTEMERTGICVELSDASDQTSGGYVGAATFRGGDYPPVGVEINVSTRNGRKIRAEPDSVSNDFVPTYTVLHVPQTELVEEKIFGALLGRKKPRDFYDTYFIMRKSMLTPDQKERLAKERKRIVTEAQKIQFQKELGALLPANQQAVIRNFSSTLERELNRQLAPL